MLPDFDLEKIKFSIDEPTWKKAVSLYENGKIKSFEESGFGFKAIVKGTSDYNVQVSPKSYDMGSCDCYLGQNETLCKHMVALAIYSLKKGEKLSLEEKTLSNEIKCSGRRGELSEVELADTKIAVSEAIKYIKAYTGPSRIWFQYQNSLTEGCNRLAKIFSDLPVSQQTANLILDILVRLDKKLTTGGIDDSDGTVGGFIEETVGMLEDYAQLDPNCIGVFKKIDDKETCFGWEEPLLKLVKD